MLKISLKVVFSLFFILNPLAEYPAQAQNNNKICEQDLGQHIDTILENPLQKRATWGILVKEPNSENILYELNSEKYFIPASNTKVLTTAAALLKLGTNYQISTPVYYTGEMPRIDSLIIVGSGDPTMTTTKLEEVAEHLKERGIDSINQLIVKDDASFSEMINGTWENSDLPYYYAPPVSDIILNENTVTVSLRGEDINQPAIIEWSDHVAGKQWRVINNVLTTNNPEDNNVRLVPNWRESTIEVTGELGLNQESRQWWLSIPNPHQYFLDSFQRVLQNEDILVSRTQVVSDDNVNLAQPLIEIKSHYLSDIINTTNKDSNNLFAEILLRQLREENKSEFDVQREILTTINVNGETYNLRDGSGLSRQNLVTPSAMVATLEGMINSPYQSFFRQSLPMAGVDGTLRNRFQDSLGGERFLAKTGTLTGVTALSGYLEMESYPDLIVSVMVNQSSEGAVILRETTDNIVNTVARVMVCD
ncbi:D-alanyl-D-alanine carboxypeptidase/D-alanyl-D-alanine-endopeptidase [Cyanobacterium stanieri LEGE 03274]|uniref:D-alanyl-D-alanine carboxypeptidase/D-alanyl-D-alanine-endopeptidase n=1 Tax=Cyanobacterium stanieri LEGE 03274 TaxID=1828756 RepID=A0ABR9V275_9CHRO|nr:D-alanyl-D-alanine carboxypeptidase/D-alanyl-D-alanine-endopeptidase [Cyanobacterium stanieri]MBE9221998.1 D-alanyl-D-alanine carboxypeptidase/D-alanyl-D-alanine-endopeptidase [Cyanobacterium stanieri LEGE 03274]